jgi:hypothetical protein
MHGRLKWIIPLGLATATLPVLAFRYFELRTWQRDRIRPGFPAFVYCAIFGEWVISHIFRLELVLGSEKALRRTAEKETGLSDWSMYENTHVQRGTRECLQMALPEANVLGKAQIRASVVQTLVTRLLLADLVKRHPEVREVPIARPIFITGLPRTGTTLLHRLLCLDPANRAPALYEMSSPCARGQMEANARKLTRQMISMAEKVALDMMKAHPSSAEDAEESFFLWQMSGLYLYSAYSSYPYPFFDRSFQRLCSEEMRRIHLEEKLFYQIMQWKALSSHSPRWVLKTPFYMASLEHLFEVFPDARVIVTKRSPMETVPSLCGLFRSVKLMSHSSVSNAEIRAAVLRCCSVLLDRYRAFAEKNAGLLGDATRYAEIEYAELICDPIGTVKKLYSEFGLEYHIEFENKMRTWLAEQPPGGKYGRQSYSAEEFGITPDLLKRTIET